MPSPKNALSASLALLVLAGVSGGSTLVAAPAAAAEAGGVLIGMSSPRPEWDLRLGQTGGVDSRRIFDNLDTPDSAVNLAKSEVAAGRMAILSFKVPGNDWAGVGNGAYDTQLRSLATKLDGVNGRVFVTLHHEPTGDGTPANYAAMMRRALPILRAPSNVDAGPIVNGFWWSKGAQGMTDAEIAQWLPTDVLRASEIVASDTYQGGTTADIGENAGVKIARMSAWATRVGVPRLGIGEYNGLDAASITAAGNAILADPRFVFAAIFNSSHNNRPGVDWTLTGDRLTAFKATVAKARTGATQPRPECPDSSVVAPSTGGATDGPAIHRRGMFAMRVSPTSTACFIYGTETDIAVMGDWDGNGSRTPGIFRGNMWYLRNQNSAGAAQISFSFGSPGDRPIVGDWDGNGTDTIGIVRANRWYLRDSNSSGAAQYSAAFGRSTDKPVAGDWNNDNKDTPGVVRANTWYLADSLAAPVANHTMIYGGSGDVPVAGDWDGNGTDTPGVYRSGMWHLSNNLSGGTGATSISFGSAGDRPVGWR